MGWIAISSCDPGDYSPQPRVKKSIFILCERIRGAWMVTMREVSACYDTFRHIPCIPVPGHTGVMTASTLDTVILQV